MQRPAECAGRRWRLQPSLGLLAAADGLLRPLAGAGVRLRTLPVHRQAAPVPDATVGADLGEALDRLLPVAPQVPLDLEIRVDVVAELRDLLVGEVADLRVRAQTELGRDLPRGRLADAVDVGQPDLEPLLVRKVDSGDACDGSALPLLVTRIAADDHGRAVPLDHAAALAHGLDGRTDLHRELPVPVGDPTAIEVVGTQLDLDLVAGEDANVVLPHPTGDGREHGVASVELHPEHRAREGFDDLAFDLDLLFFGRQIPFSQ